MDRDSLPFGWQKYLYLVVILRKGTKKVLPMLIVVFEGLMTVVLM